MLNAASTRRILFVLASSLTAFTACHARAADPPRPTTPSMEIEVDDRGPDKGVRVARWDIGFVDGRAKLKTRDGNDRYDIEAEIVNNSNPHIAFRLKRDEGDRARDLNIEASLAVQPAGRVVVARVERADGRTTLVTAHVR